MEIGDLVRCRPRHENENYDGWLGLIVAEPTDGEHKRVEWVCSADGAVETVNHLPEELVLVNANR